MNKKITIATATALSLPLLVGCGQADTEASASSSAAPNLHPIHPPRTLAYLTAPPTKKPSSTAPTARYGTAAGHWAPKPRCAPQLTACSTRPVRDA